MRGWVVALCLTGIVVAPSLSVGAPSQAAQRAAIAACVADLSSSLADPENAVAAQYVNPVVACEARAGALGPAGEVDVTVIPKRDLRLASRDSLPALPATAMPTDDSEARDPLRLTVACLSLILVSLFVAGTGLAWRKGSS